MLRACFRSPSGEFIFLLARFFPPALITALSHLTALGGPLGKARLKKNKSSPSRQCISKKVCKYTNIYLHTFITSLNHFYKINNLYIFLISFSGSFYHDITKHPIPHLWIIYQHMCNSPYKFPILYYWRTTHSLNNSPCLFK